MLTDITGQPLGSASSSATSHKNNIMVNNGATTSTGTRRASLLPGAAPTGGGPVAGSSMSDPADKKIANSASPFRHARCSLSISMVSHNSSVHADVREFEVSSILHDDSEAELSSNLWRLREQQEIPEDAEVPCPLPYTIHGEVVDEVENRSLDVRKLSKLEAGQKLELDAPQEGGLSSSSGPQGGGIVIASSPVDQAATASFLKLNTTEDDHDDEHASAFEAVVLMGQASSIREDNQTLGEAKAEEQRRTRVSSKSGANYVGTGPRDPTSSTAAGPPDPTSSAAKNAALGGTTTEGAAPRPPSSTTSVNYDMPPPRRARRSSCAGAGFERPQLEAATATNNSSQKTLVKEVPLPVLENDIEGDVPPPPAKRSRRHSISSFASAGVSNPQLDEGMIAPSQGDWQGSSQIHSQNTSRIMGPPPRSSARGRRSSGAGGPGVDFSTLSSRVLGGTPSATGGGRGMLAGLSDVEVQILEDDGDEVNKKDEPRPREQDQKRHISKPPELDGQAGAQENQSCSALPTPPAQSQHVEHNSCSSKSIATPVFGTGGASKSSRGGDAAVVFVPKNNLDISFGAACSSQGDPVSEPRTNSNKMKMQRAGGDGGIDTVAGVNKTGLERGQGDSCGGNEKLGGPRANSGAPSFGGGGSQASQPSDLVVGSASSSRVVVPAAYQPQQPSPVSPPAGARNFKNLTTTAALAAPGQVGASSSSGSSANKTSKMPIQDVLSSLRQNTVSPGLSRLRAPGFVVSKIKSALFQTAGGDGSGGQLCASAASSSAGPAPVAQFGTTAPAAPPAASTTTRAAGGLASSPRDEGKMSNMRAAIQSIFSPRAPPGGGLGGADPPGRGSQQGGLGSQLRHFISPGGAASRRRSSRFSLLELSPIAAVSTCELNESHSLNNSLFMAQPERGSGTSRASALVDELARNSKILKNQEGEQNQMNKMAAFSSVARNLVFNAPPDAGDAEFAANGKNARIEIEDEDELDEQKDPQAKRRIQDTGGAVALDDPFASNEPDVPASGGAKEVVEDLTQQLKRLHSRSRSISGDFFSPVPAVPPGPSVEQAVENVSSGPKKNVAAAVVVAPPSGSSVRAVVGKSTSSAKALQPNNVANKAPRLVGGCALSSTAPPPVSSSSQMHKNGPSALTKKPQPLLHQQKTAQLHPSTGTPSLLHQQKSTQLHPSSGIGTTGTGATGTSTTFFSSKMKNLNLTPSRYMTPAHKSASCTAYGGLYNPPQRSTPALIRPSILDTASLDDLLAARDSKGPPAGLLRCTCGRVHRMKRPCHAHPPTKGK
ncbi:unnamed protein product [Amoebophrya sp. A25]|nr:unnamed protein product [Amoebophrya sp. A25]|eukprot:GSA25T00018007001.1